MEFQIPFTFSNVDLVKRRTKFFLPAGNFLSKFSKTLQLYLKDADVEATKEEYIAIGVFTLFWAFVILSVVFTTLLFLLNSSGIFAIPTYYLIGPGAGLLFGVFMFFAQLNYPKIFVFQEGKLLDKNLLPVLQDISVQLNSGIPLFDILQNISQASYGEVSLKFKKVVKEINAGKPQAQALDDIGKRTSSVFFRRTLWQISNGMRSGSEMSMVISESINTINEEKILQIQNYGGQLSPLIVFYLLIAVIIPSLAITFLTIITSMLSLDKSMVVALFIGLFVMVIFIQITFLGMIKSRRPSLL